MLISYYTMSCKGKKKKDNNPRVNYFSYFCGSF